MTIWRYISIAWPGSGALLLAALRWYGSADMRPRPFAESLLVSSQVLAAS
jgi:hypothetical protein